HGRNALAEETAAYMAEQATAQTAPVVRAEQVNLVELPGKIRVVGMCVGLPLREAYKLAARVFDDETEPVPVGRLKRLSPLTLAHFVCRPIHEQRRMRFIERRHVQTCQSGHVR